MEPAGVIEPNPFGSMTFDLSQRNEVGGCGYLRHDHKSICDE